DRPWERTYTPPCSMKSRTQGHGADTQTAAGSGNDVEAFDQLYREHVDRIYRFAQRMCGQEDDAKDLVQDTFLNAYRGLKNFRRALHQAIVKLPKKYRLVLVLRDMEGLTAREVGSIMGLNERAVKSRLHRARLFVRRELSARGIAGHPHLARTTGST